VRCDDSANYELPEGIQSARTNARGEFEIADVVGRGNCVIEHPEYARRTLQHLSFNDVAELRVSRGGILEGRVVDTVTGNPAVGLSVDMQPISRPWPIDDAALFSASAKTDSQGRYRIGSIPTGKFNVFVSSVPGRASVALDSLAIQAGQVVPAPPIRLVKGGLVKGRLIDDATGEPAVAADDEHVKIGAYGPSRPPSGAAIEGFPVRTDGTFELRLPPGKNHVYLSGGPFLVRKPGDPYASQDIREINVKEGAETTIEFRVTRQVPMKKAPANSKKKSPPPTSGAVSRSAPIAVVEARPSASDARPTKQDAPSSDENFRPRLAAEYKSSAHDAVGRFTGIVRLDGVAPKRNAAPNDLEGSNGKSSRDESLRINRTVDNGIADVFIYLAEAPGGRLFVAPPQAFCLRTDGKAFSPRAGIMRVGQALTLRNDSQISSNFHFYPNRDNPMINQVVPPGGQTRLQARFAVPERAPFEVRSDRCSQMRASLLVLDHPFAAVTDELGAFEIADLPPGKYSFRVWHERAGFLERALSIEITPGKTAKAKLSYKLDRFEH
jgi:hypothetical protein